jgi:hypothetical protein
LTYNCQGTKKPGATAADHAIIFTGRMAPDPLPGENGMYHRPIRVEPFKLERLAPESRVNYAKIYTIEHNVKVCSVGKIHEDSEATFFEDFKLIDSRS